MLFARVTISIAPPALVPSPAACRVIQNVPGFRSSPITKSESLRVSQRGWLGREYVTGLPM